MAQNYGYETLMTELPTYMKQVLRFSIKTVNIFARARKHFAMFISSHASNVSPSFRPCLIPSWRIMTIRMTINDNQELSIMTIMTIMTIMKT